jgi:D-cysteine desulfhydrase family pyridoxal phosphate-dependent enzyme
MSEGISPGIDRKRRVALVHAPTQFEPLKGLTRLLGGPEIWIKRDDCTGLALGGSKARKLEFLLADARGAGADTIITVGAPQSNHLRMTAAAARVIGMESISLMFPGPSGARQGNLLLDELLGTEIVMLPFPFAESSVERIEQEVAKVSERVTAAGRKPYFIPAGGATPLGALGYFRATEELAVQARREGCQVDTVVVSFGTGGTIAGILLGVDALRLNWKVYGISAAHEEAWEHGGVAPYEQLAREAAALLGLDFRLGRERCDILYDYVGEGYAKLTPACAEAVRMVARSDGILLDPVYTGKAMAGLIDLVRTGRLVKGQTVVFLHTGGAPALFAHPEILDV